MKMNKFFMGIMGALALTACTSEEVIPDQKPNIGEGEPRYMSVSIRNANPGTRAEGEPTTVAGGIYEEGYSSENKINSLRFYFFDADGKPVAIDLTGKSYYETDNVDNTGNPDMDQTVEKVLNAVIVINSTDNQIGSKIKKMVAIANYKSIVNKLVSKTPAPNTPIGNLSLDELLEVVGDETELNVGINSENGFVMTSSSYFTDKSTCEVEITEENIKESRELAAQFPVDIYVERVVAKVRVKTDWSQDSNMAPEDVTFNGNPCVAIPLLSKLSDGSIKNITVDNTDNGKQVYVIFGKWDLWWTADRSYLFKKIGDWDNVVGDWWNSKTFHRSYWAENPEDVKLKNHPHNFVSKNILSSDKFSANNVANEAAYCLENAAQAATPSETEKYGLMKTYDPDKETTPRTLVYLSAILVTVENGVAEPIEIAEWAANRSTVEGIKAHMFKTNENVIYFREKEPTQSTSGTTETGSFGGQVYRMFPVTVNDLHFVSGLDADMANDKVENSPRYLSYLTLPEAEEDLFANKVIDGTSVELVHQLYQKNADDTYSEVTPAAANNLYASVGGAKIYKDGNTYYYHEINHLNTEDKTGQKGQFGVVRNHIYEVVLNSVYGMGTPVLTPEDGTDPDNWEDIIPQKPSNEFYLGARINILSWRVVNNGVSLDW